MSKSKLGCHQPETNQILKIEDVAIVQRLIKYVVSIFAHLA